jgi:rhomboid-like protein
MLRLLKRQRTLRLPVVLDPTPRTSRFQIYVKPVLVSIGLTAGTFTIAALVHERQAGLFWKQLRVEKPEFGNLRHIITDQQLLWLDLVQEKAKLWKQRQEEILQDLKQRLEQMTMPESVKRTVYQATQAYFNLPESKKTITGLIGLNMLVFIAWRIPPLRPSLQRQFFSGRHMLSSCFAHRNALHLTANMVGLYIFGPLIYNVLGREQFLACYVSLGINANLMGHLLSVALKRPAVMANYGANGSVYGLLAGSALLYPETTIAVPFLPMLATPIK